MNLVIKFPTRGRPEKFISVLDQYIAKAHEEVKLIVSCDTDDNTMNNKDMIARLKLYSNVELNFSDNKTKIEAVNNNLAEVDFDILLLASDDMIPIEDGYDALIKKAMQKCYPDLDGVLWFNDGHQGMKMNTLSIMGKKYYDRFNYLYHPSYTSLWCDTEFMDVANILEKQTYFDRVIIEHQHPDWGFEVQRDEIHQANAINNSADRQNYIARKLRNFYL